MNKNRPGLLMAMVVLCFMLLTGRIFYLQFIKGNKLAKAATVQRIANKEFEKPRGNILDRNSIPLTNRDKKSTIVLKPLSLKGKEDEVEKICDILKVDYADIRRQVEVKREPIFVDTDEYTKDQVMALGIDGVSAVNSLKRYDENSIARHVLGYVKKADQVGETGIEKAYEDILKIDGENKIGVVTDARYNLVRGIGYRMITAQQGAPSVMLTLDYHLQKIVEEVLEDSRIAGAVVIEDVATGDILAMASKPDFDQNDVGKFLENSNNALFNRAVASYNIGSIFKIIDVAKYLEMKLPVSQTYYCPGYVRVGDKEFRCSSYERGGHGWVDLKEAFAVSCNTYFINMGISMGSKNLVEMAQRFGLGSATKIDAQGIPEAPGNLPVVTKYITDGNTANTAIGQGDVMATPLQVADLIATVANGGIKNKVNIVDSIVDDDLNKLNVLRKDEGKRIISKEICDQLKMMMEEVTATGTGVKAKLEAYGGAAGKTGSAETGQYINGRKVVHAWFGGYFPKRQPRYSMAVFIEDGKAGSEAAAPIFAEIAQEILKRGL